MVGDPDGGDGLAFGLVFKLVFGAVCTSRHFDRLLEREAQVDLRLVPVSRFGWRSDENVPSAHPDRYPIPVVDGTVHRRSWRRRPQESLRGAGCLRRGARC
jgi:hypothetical protein